MPSYKGYMHRLIIIVYTAYSILYVFMQRLDPNHPTPTMQDFDKKLTETDSYLQILIDQVKV